MKPLLVAIVFVLFVSMAAFANDALEASIAAQTTITDGLQNDSDSKPSQDTIKRIGVILHEDGRGTPLNPANLDSTELDEADVFAQPMAMP